MEKIRVKEYDLELLNGKSITLYISDEEKLENMMKPRPFIKDVIMGTNIKSEYIVQYTFIGCKELVPGVVEEEYPEHRLTMIELQKENERLKDEIQKLVNTDLDEV